MIVDSHTVVRINTERAHVFLTWFPPVVTSGKIMVQGHNLDIDNDKLRYRTHHKIYLVALL